MANSFSEDSRFISDKKRSAKNVSNAVVYSLVISLFLAAWEMLRLEPVCGNSF